MAIKLLIVLSIFLNQSYGCTTKTDKLNSNALADVTSVITDINDKWLVNFVGTNDNRNESCQVMPIARRIFIADAECIYHAAKVDHGSITVDFYHGSMVFSNMTSVQDRNIFYNEFLTSEYDPNKRKIAVLFADQPVLADRNRTLVRSIAQKAYQEVLGYNEANQIKEIPRNISETNFSKCYMPIFNGRNASVPCFELKSAYSKCQFTLTDSTFPQHDNLLNYLMCHVRSSREKVVLVGVLSRPNQPSISSPNQSVAVDYENIDDLSHPIQSKRREWFANNPHL